LALFIGFTQAEADDNFGAPGAGGLKAVGIFENRTELWKSPNSGATNTSGFSAIPGGLRFGSSGEPIDLGAFGTWWTSTESNENAGEYWQRYLSFQGTTLFRFDQNQGWGHSIRCISGSPDMGGGG